MKIFFPVCIVLFSVLSACKDANRTSDTNQDYTAPADRTAASEHYVAPADTPRNLQRDTGNLHLQDTSQIDTVRQNK